MRLLLRWLILIFLLLTSVAISPPAGARQFEKMAVSPSNPKVRRNFPPMTASAPSVQAQDPTTCRTAQHCDTIPLDVIVPDDFEDNYAVRVAMSFTEDATENSDMDLFLYNQKEQPAGRSAGSGNPEVIRARLDPEPYFIVPLLWLGAPNSVPYTIEVEFIPIARVSRSRTSLTESPRPRTPPTNAGAFDGGDFEAQNPSAGGPMAFEEPATLEDPPTVDSAEPIGSRISRRASASAVENPDGIKFDRGRLMSGIGLLGFAGVAGYVLLLLPRPSRASARPEGSASEPPGVPEEPPPGE